MKRSLRQFLKKRILHPIEAVIFLGAIGFFRLFSVDRASAIGGWLGRNFGPLVSIHRLAKRNMHRCFPEKSESEIQGHLDAMWDHLGRILGEFAHLPKFGRDSRRIEVVGTEIIDYVAQTYNRGLGVSGHYGNWEVAAYALVRKEFPFSTLYRPPSNPLVDRIFRRLRSGIDPNPMQKGLKAGLSVARILRDGGKGVLMLIDQKSHHLKLTFFGRPAYTIALPASLARKYGFPLVMARCERLQGAYFRVTIYPPIPVQHTHDADADVRAAMQTVNDTLESWVREKPEQWFWLHNRWAD